ncbi:MAG TPA: MerR family transcriptional regulator [Syntrophales bacterium]|nr:MerR family transcriptional regulator [Syntrophales bacterium]HOL58847.1 MerR family transcriptional regulator [Syntrophales bacterium]HPO35174.1 MerR family transcriptional regulator [Syntrophales bacterium]
MKEETEIKIGELARRLNLSPRTIRYYEEIGLLNSIKRIEGGRRIYTDADLRRLKLIKRLKTLGLTLAEMQELEAIWSIEKSNDKVLKRLLELLDGHLSRLEERIKDLSTLKMEIQQYRERIRAKITEHQSSPGSSRGTTSKLPSEG